MVLRHCQGEIGVEKSVVQMSIRESRVTNLVSLARSGNATRRQTRRTESVRLNLSTFGSIRGLLPTSESGSSSGVRMEVRGDDVRARAVDSGGKEDGVVDVCGAIAGTAQTWSSELLVEDEERLSMGTVSEMLFALCFFRGRMFVRTLVAQIWAHSVRAVGPWNVRSAKAS